MKTMGSLAVVDSLKGKPKVQCMKSLFHVLSIANSGS
jgi:hypothetical protein